MALQINGTTVVDNSRNLTNVNGYYGNGVATQSEAEAGTNNDQLMTPLRVAQSIRANNGVVYNYSGSFAYERWNPPYGGDAFIKHTHGLNKSEYHITFWGCRSASTTSGDVNTYITYANFHSTGGDGQLYKRGGSAAVFEAKWESSRCGMRPDGFTASLDLSLSPNGSIQIIH